MPFAASTSSRSAPPAGTGQSCLAAFSRSVNAGAAGAGRAGGTPAVPGGRRMGSRWQRTASATGVVRTLFGRGGGLGGHDGRARDGADGDWLVDGDARIEVARLAVAGLVRGPCARDAPAEQRRADHDAL